MRNEPTPSPKWERRIIVTLLGLVALSLLFLVVVGLVAAVIAVLRGSMVPFLLAAGAVIIGTLAYLVGDQIDRRAPW